ncbi:MAG: type II toxin-antitoxin system RelE/ParE family toxin [Planctomycetota bacterium]
MNVSFGPLFEKDLKHIKDKNLRDKILDVIDRVKQAKSITEIPNLKKLKGHKIYYRVRVGDNYRLGISIERDLVEFSRFEHRSSAYSTFPPR